MACSGVSLETGGSTEKASQVRKTMFLGWPQTAGSWTLGMNSRGYEALVFSVIEISLKLTFLFSSSPTFSRTVPNLIALKISGSFSGVRPMHLA